MFTIRAIDYLQKRKDRKNDHFSSILDEFWFRQVFSLQCIKPLIEFITLEMEVLQDLDTNGKNGSFIAYTDKFQSEKDKLIRKFMLFSEWNRSIYDLVSEKLDEIDDVITFYCAGKELGKPHKVFNTFSYVEQEVYTKFGILLKNITAEHINLDKNKSDQKWIHTYILTQLRFLELVNENEYDKKKD